MRRIDRKRHQLNDSTAPAVLITALLLHFAGLASLHFGYLNFLFNDSQNRLGQGSDFFAIYQAGHDFLHGISVYVPRQPNSGGDVPYAYAFRYLPSVAFSFGAAFNVLPAWPAYWTWVGFNEVLLFINVALTWRFAPGRTLRIVCVVMWLVYAPFYLELFMGQFNFLMATLIFWLGLTVMRSWRDGICASWTASLLAKTNSAILLPVAWRTGWLRPAIAGIAFAALVNLPYFVLVAHSWNAWYGNFHFIGDRPDVIPHAGNLGLAALLALFRQTDGSGAPDVALRLTGQLPWGFVAIVISLAATLRASPRRVLPLLALWLCVYFFVFDDVWEHQYVLLLPALVLLTLFDDEMRPWAVLAYVILALPTPYALFQIATPRGVNYQLTDPQVYWSGVEVYLYHVIKILPTLLLWCSCLAILVFDFLPQHTAKASGHAGQATH